MSISSYICVERKKDDGPNHERFSESIDRNYFFDLIRSSLKSEKFDFCQISKKKSAKICDLLFYISGMTLL